MAREVTGMEALGGVLGKEVQVTRATTGTLRKLIGNRSMKEKV